MSNDRFIDYGAIWRKYRRYWWLFVASLIVCCSLAWLYLRVKAPEYLVMSTVMVSESDSSTGSGSKMGASSMLKTLALGGSGTKVDDEIVVMGSHELCRNMIKELGLNRRYYEKKGFLKKEDHYNTSPVVIDCPESVLDTLTASLSFKIKVNKKGLADITVKKGLFTTLAEKKGVKLPYNVITPWGAYQVKAANGYTPGKEVTINAVVAGNDMLAEKMAEKMVIRTVNKKANAIYLDVVDSNIKRGKDILNTIIALYNERSQQEKDEEARNTGAFIEKRIAIVHEGLTGSEANIEAYKRSHGIADVELQTKTLIGRQERADNQVIRLETRYRIVGMIKEFVSDPKNRYSYIPFDVDSTAASSPVRAYNELIVQRTRLAASANPSNQQMQVLDDQIDAMRANVLKGVNNTLDALKVQIGRANTLSSSSLGEMSKLPSLERDMRSLYRQQGIQNELYTFLLEKREQNALVLAATTPRGRIVDKAYAKNEPVLPRKMQVFFVTLLATLLLPVIILYIKNLLNTKFSNQDELAAAVKAPVLGEICHNNHSTALVVKPGKSSSIVELFRLLRGNVQFTMTGRDDKVVLVTSSVSGEGKSLVSLNLASSFALLGKKVALVGMDIRSPQLAQMLGINETPGVTSYLSGSDVDLSSIVQSCTEVEGLDVLPGGAIPPNPSELLLGERTPQLVSELRERYDIVIVDSAPIALVSDTFSLSPLVDATLFVVRASYTRRSLLRTLNGAIERKQLKNVSLVLNDTKMTQSMGYGYGYGKDKD